LIVDASSLDSAQKFPKEVLYKTYFFDKQRKKTTGEWGIIFCDITCYYFDVDHRYSLCKK
jgi:hypothetical protein